MATDARRAQADWMLTADDGRVQRGASEVVIDDAGLNVGLVGLSFLDVDGLRAADHRIELDLWPGGNLVLSALGRRYAAFLAELPRARNRVRVAGLLAHAPNLPDVYEGAQLSTGSATPVELQVYSTHLTVVPADADPWQISYGAVEDVTKSDAPPAVKLTSGLDTISFGQLARRRDAFFQSVTAARNAQSQLPERLTGSRVFSDGLGVPQGRVAGFDSLLRNFSSPERHDGARWTIPEARYVSAGQEVLEPDDANRTRPSVRISSIRLRRSRRLPSRNRRLSTMR